MSLRKRAARTGSPFSLFSPSFGGVGEVSLSSLWRGWRGLPLFAWRGWGGLPLFALEGLERSPSLFALEGLGRS